jgi:hypothetical protein
VREKLERNRERVASKERNRVINEEKITEQGIYTAFWLFICLLFQYILFILYFPNMRALGASG